jgi:hypothetical protein
VGVASSLVNADPGSRSANAATLLLYHAMMPDTPASERLLYGMSYAREAFELLGAFRDDLRIGEDTEFNSRLRAAEAMVLHAPDVVTAHRNPTGPRALLRDQYMRGVRQARARRASGQPRAGLAVARVAVGNLRQARRHLRRVEASEHRRRLSSGWPLLGPAAAAYAAGALAATAAEPRRRRKDRSGGRA